MTLRDSPQNSAGKKGSDGPNKVVKLTSCAEESFSSGSVVKNSPAKQEMQVRFLGWEEPVGKEMATHSSILTWEILWTEEPGRLQSMGSQRIGHDRANKRQPSLPDSRELSALNLSSFPLALLKFRGPY